MLKRMTVLIVFLFINLNAFAQCPFKNFTANYKFEFSGLKVGEGILTAYCDNNSYIVHFKAQTSKFISIFYKLKVDIEDAVDVKSLKDIYYRAKFRGSSNKDVYVKFDNATTADVYYKKKHLKHYVLSSKNGVYSPLSVYLFFVEHPFEFSKTYFKDVVISKHLYRVEILPLKETIVNIDMLKRKKGKREAIEAELTFYKLNKGRFEKKKDVKKMIVFVSKNQPKIPLLSRMWHIIGVFGLRLTKLSIQ